MSGDQLPPPSPSMLDGKSLFLDLDGTLFELVDRPEDVIADAPLLAMLDRLQRRLEGRLAIVSGRSIEQIDRILGDFAHEVALSGSHGSEHRWRGIAARPVRPAALIDVAGRFKDFAAQHEGVIVEEKSYGVGLHFRQAPHVEREARDMAVALAQASDLYLQDGKLMVELRMTGGDKGTAVRRLMTRAPMALGIPLFVGDDITDETGFEVARELGGGAVLVGDRRPTAAAFSLPDPAAVRGWLTEYAA